MIGGEDAVVKRLDPIFATLAPGAGTIARTPGWETVGGTAERGYLHCGTNGAGHFVKMVHNGIEYGIMAAYAEGLGVLRSANVGKRGPSRTVSDPRFFSHTMPSPQACDLSASLSAAPLRLALAFAKRAASMTSSG